MNKTLLISKLHRINVTEVELDYEGSCALDTDFIKAGKMQPYQKVDIYNVTNGERFSTYLIAAEAGSKTVSINGAAAHKASPKDFIIICAYGEFNEVEAETHEPVLVYFDQENNITHTKSSIPEQKLHSV